MPGIERGGQVRCVLVQLADNRIGRPEKYTRIPEKLARFHEHLGKLAARFLCEGLHLVYAPTGLGADLDVAVARLRARGAYAQSQQRVVILHKVEPFANRLLEQRLTGYQVVARRNHYRCLRVDRLDVVSCPGYARSGVAACRLKEYLALVKLRKLLADMHGILLVGEKQNVLTGHD